MPSRTAAFVKFFSEEAHADQFLRGGLFMQKLRYFQRLEAQEVDDGRPDAREGVVSVHQPANTELTIQFDGMEPLKITEADLAGPVVVTRNVYSDMNVFCMSTLRIPDVSGLRGSIDDIQAQVEDLTRLDDRCLAFGPHAVVVDAANFVGRLRSVLPGLGHWFRAGAVEYYDEATFHGSFAEEQAPFMKQNPFSYQKEFRICLLRPDPSDELFILDIGDISAFALKMGSGAVNSALRVTPRSSTAEG